VYKLVPSQLTRRIAVSAVQSAVATGQAAVSRSDHGAVGLFLLDYDEDGTYVLSPLYAARAAPFRPAPPTAPPLPALPVASRKPSLPL
jgi:hypothetical protein